MDIKSKVERHSENISFYNSPISAKKIIELLIQPEKSNRGILFKQVAGLEEVSSYPGPQDICLLHVRHASQIPIQPRVICKERIRDSCGFDV